MDVLGPPTVKQTDTIKKQREQDPDEFWHFQAAATRSWRAEPAARQAQPLFPRTCGARDRRFPSSTRWLVYHARKIARASNCSQIVRMLDKADEQHERDPAVPRSARRSLLFPGDAQIENWQYALGQRAGSSKLLASVNVYKVGHHGSLNATPKSLWKPVQEQVEGSEGPRSA